MYYEYVFVALQRASRKIGSPIELPSLNKDLTYLLQSFFYSHAYSMDPLEPTGTLKDLTRKAPIMTAADDSHEIFFHCFSEKMRLDVSSESSARQRIHMKNQAVFSSKNESKQINVVCCNFCLTL